MNRSYFCILIIIILFISGCGEESEAPPITGKVTAEPIKETNPPKEDPFSYKLSDCEEEQEELGIYSVEWKTDSELEIKAFIGLKCDESIKKADYEINGNTLYLTYLIDRCEGCGDCNCAKEIKYNIDGISKSGYKYRLMGI